jgi:ankyrin repeat protein
MNYLAMDYQPPLEDMMRRPIDQLVFRLENGHDDIEARDHLGYTPLHVAAHRGLADAVNVFIDHGADVHTLSDSGHSTLYSAASNGHAAVVGILHANGVDAELAESTYMSTPLHLAAFGSHIDVVRMLVDFGVDQSKTDDEGRTALDYALLQYERYAKYPENGQFQHNLARSMEVVDILNEAEFMKQRRLAFAMGGHTRLGEGSFMREKLIDDLIDKIARLI